MSGWFLNGAVRTKTKGWVHVGQIGRIGVPGIEASSVTGGSLTELSVTDAKGRCRRFSIVGVNKADSEPLKYRPYSCFGTFKLTHYRPTIWRPRAPLSMPIKLPQLNVDQDPGALPLARQTARGTFAHPPCFQH
jgi:hypothetical protein